MRSRWVLLASSLLACACKAKDEPPAEASATLPAVAPPVNLLAELSIGNPKETWQRVRGLGGDAAQALPSSLPVLLTTSLSLPPSAAGSLDDGLPLVGVLLSRSGAAEPDAVFGLHVVSGSELVASLTLGDSARFRRTEPGPRLVRLLPRAGAPQFDGALGVSGNYLLLATRAEALEQAGRFVAESVSRRARSEPGLSLRAPEKALKGRVSQALRAAWSARRAALGARAEQERDARGRAADFADPEVLLGGIDRTMTAWLDVVDSARALSLELVPEGDRLRLSLSLEPQPEGPAALLSRELVTGSLSPLLRLPAGTGLALFTQGEAEATSAPDRSVAASLVQLFGERLRPAEAERLQQAFAALGESRRGASVVALSGGPAPSLLITCELRDAQAFAGAVADVLGLLQLPPVSAWLASLAGKPQLQLLPSSGASRRARLRFAPSAQAQLALPRELFLSWEARDGVGYFVATSDSELGLGPFAEPERLGASEWLTQAGRRAGEHSSLGLFADARLLHGPSSEPAPLLLTFGKEAERIVVSLEAAPGALHAIAPLFALDRAR